MMCGPPVRKTWFLKVKISGSPERFKWFTIATGPLAEPEDMASRDGWPMAAGFKWFQRVVFPFFPMFAGKKRPYHYV